MRALRFLVATAIGFLLYQFAVVYIGGFLAALPIPGAYFQFFGREHLSAAHALLGITLHAVPTVLLIAGGILAAERAFKRGDRARLLGYALGMLVCAAVWQLFAASACLPSLERSCAASSYLESLLRLPWWALPVVVSPWLGLALAAAASRGSNQAMARSAA